MSSIFNGFVNELLSLLPNLILPKPNNISNPNSEPRFGLYFNSCISKWVCSIAMNMR